MTDTEFKDFTPLSPNSKIKLEDRPSLFPGHCAVCGGGQEDGRQYVDFGLTLEWFGTVYLCGHCLSEITGYLKWPDPETYRKLREAYDYVNERVISLEDANDKLRNALASLDILRHPVFSASSIHSVSTEDDAEISPESNRIAPVSFISSPSEEFESSGQDNERRSKDISDNEQDFGDGGDSGDFELEI